MREIELQALSSAAVGGASPAGQRIAVIGGGISGLAAAHRLARRHRVTLFEAGDYVGGHTHTVDVTIDGVTHPVDTGFLVFNERTYPNLIRLFAELGVPTAPSDMSFSVSVGPHDFEWCGSDLGSLFAQPANALRPGFWSMLADILRFNRQATALAQGQVTGAADPGHGTLPLGEWLDRNRYGRPFRDWYLLPMAAAIWSCPTEAMLAFPVCTFARFCHNHGLLQVSNRPQWHTVRGGAREYVRRIVAGLSDVRTGTPVRAVRRMRAPDSPAGSRSADAGAVRVTTDRETLDFDQVVLACHSDQALALLQDAAPDERAVLQAIPYQPNRAWLHTDRRLMPARRRAWAAWNYLSAGADRPRAAPPDTERADGADAAVSVTYWLNRLQPVPFETPVLLTLNPLSPPDPAQTIAVYDYAHPAFDLGAMAAQRRLPGIQGRSGTWFAGAWTGYGFHEDGLKSGLAVADAIESRHDEQLAAATHALRAAA